jgi:hypothetical protein
MAPEELAPKGGGQIRGSTPRGSYGCWHARWMGPDATWIPSSHPRVTLSPLRAETHRFTLSRTCKFEATRRCTAREHALTGHECTFRSSTGQRSRCPPSP